MFPFDRLGKVTVFLFFVCFIPALLYRLFVSQSQKWERLELELEFVVLFVLIASFRRGLVYLFLLCTVCSVVLLSVFSGIFES